MDCSPPGSSVHGILQARTTEWVAISYSTLIIREMKIKTTMRLVPHYLSEWLLSKRHETTNVGEDVEKNPHTLLVGMRVAALMKNSMEIP